MNLGRRIKRAEQAEARQNPAFGGAMSLQPLSAPLSRPTFASIRLTSTMRPRSTTTSPYPLTNLRPGCQ